MKLIAHRRNTRQELVATPTQYGVEVDVRSHGKELIIHHDAFTDGESFITWIKQYRHGTLILNVKEEGLEEQLISIMASYGITDYFFLDQSFPFIVKWAKQGERRCAIRVSEFESINTALTLQGQVDWIWVDCFTRFPLTHDDAQTLQNAGFKLCLVSPELHTRDAEIEIPALINTLSTHHINVDAVCTKRVDLWERLVCL